MQLRAFSNVRPMAMQTPRFGEQSPEEKLSARLSALAEQPVRVQTSNSAADEVTVTLGNSPERFVVSGLRTQYGTAPERYTMRSVETGETIQYSGAGCFGTESVGYQPPNTRGQAAQVRSSEAVLVNQALQLFTQVQSQWGQGTP
jgi:hypothetical protein